MKVKFVNVFAVWLSKLAALEVDFVAYNKFITQVFE